MEPVNDTLLAELHSKIAQSIRDASIIADSSVLIHLVNALHSVEALRTPAVFERFTMNGERVRKSVVTLSTSDCPDPIVKE